MRKFLRLLTILAVLVSGGFVHAGVEEDKEQLRNLETSCAAALVSGDIPFLAAFYADHWILIGSDGQRFSRQQTLAWLSLGRLKWESCVYDEMDVRVFGDTAIVVYKATAHGEVHGARIDETEICSDTFVRVDNTWRCVHSQNSQMP